MDQVSPAEGLTRLNLGTGLASDSMRLGALPSSWIAGRIQFLVVTVLETLLSWWVQVETPHFLSFTPSLLSLVQLFTMWHFLFQGQQENLSHFESLFRNGSDIILRAHLIRSDLRTITFSMNSKSTGQSSNHTFLLSPLYSMRGDIIQDILIPSMNNGKFYLLKELFHQFPKIHVLSKHLLLSLGMPQEYHPIIESV